MKKERAIELISKLLRTSSDRGASENEAVIAALRAQELMAKYNIDIADVSETEDDRIVEFAYDTATGNKWKYNLAKTVADNFCCKVYTINRKKICFYGMQKHSEVAVAVFKFLYEMGNKFVARYYAQEKRKGNDTKNLRNDFFAGYLQGIRSVLQKQCTALLLVVPQEVEDSYKKKWENEKKNTINSKIHYNASNERYEEGLEKGKGVAQSRYIE